MPNDHNLVSYLLASGKDDAPAILSGAETVTYGELREKVYRWAAFLLEKGLQPGDRVALCAENGPFFVAAYLGILRAGLCAVPCPIDLQSPGFQKLLERFDVRAAILSRRIRPRYESLEEETSLLWTDEETALPENASATTWPSIDPAVHLAAIMPTSGSTGQPKGVMVSHQNIAANTRDIVAYLELSPDDRAMLVLPLYYCYGTSVLHTLLAAGASIVINNRFMFPEKVLDEMVERSCTGLAGVPSTYQILLRKTHFAQRSFPSLRWLQQAGGKLANPFIQEIRTSFPSVKLFIMYGQTEATARLSYLPPDRLADKLGSIGRGLPGTRLELLDENGTAIPPGSEAIGEIVASGDNITFGYWNDTEETANYFRDGKLYTGDMARSDADGFIFIVERGRDFIKAMGNRVSPKEIEEVISEMPEVVETAVVGVPHELWGEAVKAFITTASEGLLSADAVRQHCLKKLPNHKVPEFIEFLPRMPRTANGKIAKEELRKRSL